MTKSLAALALALPIALAACGGGGATIPAAGSSSGAPSVTQAVTTESGCNTNTLTLGQIAPGHVSIASGQCTYPAPGDVVTITSSDPAVVFTLGIGPEIMHWTFTPDVRGDVITVTDVTSGASGTLTVRI